MSGRQTEQGQPIESKITDQSNGDIEAGGDDVKAIKS